MKTLTPAVRQKIYAILTALVPLGVIYGVISDSEASLWLAVAVALLGGGGTALAAANTHPEGGKWRRGKMVEPKE